MRHDTYGVPLQPAMIAKERADVTPLLRRGCRQGDRLRCDTACFPSGNNAVPMFVLHRPCDLCIIVAALGEHNDVTRLMGADRIFQVETIDGVDHEFMLGLIGHRMLSAIPCTLKGYRGERHQDVVDDQDHIGPLMSDNNPLAMIESLGVFRMYTGTMLDGALHQEGTLPG
jgi:hypothetical protein